MNKFEKYKLAIVCPMANEALTVEQFVKDIFSYCTGFKDVKFYAVLDNVSKDNTREILVNISKTNNNISVVWAPENRNVVDAYIKGYKVALENKSDWILEIDAGYSHLPQEIPQFFEKMAEGYDCVFGSRFCKGGEMQDPTFIRYIVSRGGTALINFLLRTKLTDMTSGFELFKKEALTYILNQGISSKGHFFQTEIKAHSRKFNIAEVPIHYSSPSPSLKFSSVVDAFKNLFKMTLNNWKKLLIKE